MAETGHNPVLHQLLPLVGNEIVIALGAVDRLAMQRYATAVGDLNPLYFDREAARRAGHRDVIVPPNFITSCYTGWRPGPPQEQMCPDGLDPDFLGFPVAGRVMGGGQEIEFLKPACAGDEITARRVLADVRERQAKNGELYTFVTMQTRYANQHGETLMVLTDTMIIGAQPEVEREGEA